MTKSYDLVVLGSGAAGGTIAANCREAGWRVALLDPLPLGGTCALRGCEPKKVFWTLAEAADRAHKLAPVGLGGGAAVALDWPAIQRFKHSFTDPVPGHQAARYRELGIDVYPVAGRFTGANALQAGEETLQFRHAVIATGSKPTRLGIDGEELLGNSDTFLDLETLPAQLTLIGGGYIAFEIAHMARRGGADVTILHKDERPLAQFDQALVRQLVAATREAGITVELNVTVTGVKRTGSGFIVQGTQAGKTLSMPSALVLHAAGRSPNVGELALEQAGIELDGHKLQLTPQLQTTNPAIYAAGDAAAMGPALTPVASLDAATVTANLLRNAGEKSNYQGVPSAVFALPPLTAVGLTEEAARQQGLDYECHEGSMAGFQTMRRLREEAAFYRVLVERGTSRLLGAHLLGPGSEEVINLFAIAIRLGWGAPELQQLQTAYPSFSSNLGSMLK
jgi:glutathione reductase (NADPH)